MPPSPAAQRHNELMQLGLHHLLQHDTNASFSKQERYKDSSYSHSIYRSPRPDEVYTHSATAPRCNQQQDTSPENDSLNKEFHRPVFKDQYDMLRTSSPTPLDSEILRTRSGRGIHRHQNIRPMPEGQLRGDKSPKPKKIKKEKIKLEKRVAKLEKPLSELTKDWTHVPVVDIEAYVNRSAEVRRKEVEEGKIPGKVKRPMNSFMLYRKAYQNRTKDWCLQNNHQVVSQVCGDSWPLEPDSVKGQFSEWARIERLNHQNAHPGYKFSPSKPGSMKASKRKMSAELVSDESDVDDFNWMDPSFRPEKKIYDGLGIPPRVDAGSDAYSDQRPAYQYFPRENSIEPSYEQNVLQRSSYHVSNPGKSMPAPYSNGLNDGEYYEQTIQTHQGMPDVQDIILRKTATPNMHSYLGIPGGGTDDFDILSFYNQYENSQYQELKIDPSLVAQALTYENTYEDGSYVGDYMQDDMFYDTIRIGDQVAEQQWQALSAESERGPVMEYSDPVLHSEETQTQDADAHIPREHQEGWQVETLEHGGEFEKWIEEE